MRSSFLIILFLTFFGLSSQGQNQFPSQIWHQGMVVLMEGDSIRGRVKYDLDNNIVQLTDNQTVDTFSALQVRMFEIFDEIYGDFRYFYSIPFVMGNETYERPIFFEVLFEGRLTLLAREYIVSDSPAMMNPWMMRGAFWWPYQRLAFNFFFLDVRNGRVTPYNQKRRNLLNLTKPHENEVRSFIKQNNLKTDRRTDLVKIISYYNGLL
jgi:hypothetical protein